MCRRLLVEYLFARDALPQFPLNQLQIIWCSGWWQSGLTGINIQNFGVDRIANILLPPRGAAVCAELQQRYKFGRHSDNAR